MEKILTQFPPEMSHKLLNEAEMLLQRYPRRLSRNPLRVSVGETSRSRCNAHTSTTQVGELPRNETQQLHHDSVKEKERYP